MTRMFAEEKAGSRSQFKEKLLRPPGEGFRLQIGEIREEIMEKGMVLAVLLVESSFLVLLLQGSTLKINLLIWSVVSVICYGAAYCQWKKIKALREKLRNHRLGFDGERYVAEKLAELSAQGYRVFHDFVFDMKPGGDATNFNIDHIVVGTNGVFALETKMVPVLSGKPVAKMLPREGKRGALTDSEVRSISDRIEAHCRNVDGA